MALRKIYFVEDIMERYRCRSKDTARRYMRQMGANGTPLFVTEEMINAWEDSKKRSETRPKTRFRVPKGVTEIPGRKAV